ncbi:MAG TPA: helix-turn-helix transcriptional regulator [Polyangiaceae bacterium]
MALTEVQNQQIADRVREALARRRISRQALADEARISVSTLEKALAGDRPFSLASLVRIEQVLGVALRSIAVATPQVAPPELGSYVRSSVAWLEGEYLTLRPSFEAAGSIHAYCTTIAWEESQHCLQFREGERLDSANAQVGHVSLPAAKGKVYLSTSANGEMRLAILNSPTRGGEFSGLLLTLTASTPGLPVTTPIVLVPRKPEHRFGRFARGDALFSRYQTMLAEARKAVHIHDVPGNIPG